MTGIIILAAGNSSRMGKPKQNLFYRGKTLLQHAVAAAVCADAEPVVVVLGAYADLIMPEIEGHAISIVVNKDWEQGMSSSIRIGIAEMQKVPGIDSVIIMLCDQPFTDDQLIYSLIHQYRQTGKGIIACTYNGTTGVPVLFSRRYFAALQELQGHEGAKKLLGVFIDDIAEVDFEKGKTDIDTMLDYDQLIG